MRISIEDFPQMSVAFHSRNSYPHTTPENNISGVILVSSARYKDTSGDDSARVLYKQ